MKSSYLELILKEFYHKMTRDCLSDIVIYNYLDNITEGFDIARVRIFIGEILDVKSYLRDWFYDEQREIIEDETVCKFLNDSEREFLDKAMAEGEGYHFQIEFYETEKIYSYLERCGFNFKVERQFNNAVNWNFPRAEIMLRKKLHKTEQINTNQLSNIESNHHIAANRNIPDLALQEFCNAIIPDNLLQALQEYGFIENAAAKPVKWLKTKSLLAYFAEVANDKLNLKHGEKRQIKPFETLFDVSGLISAKNDYKKTGDFPIGHEDIDKLFS
jgi:hypothetical protein